MTSKEIKERYNELNKDNSILCTATELEEFMVSGLLFKSGKSYIDKNRNEIKVKTIKVKTNNFDLDFNDLISICEEKSKNEKIKRIYCMSESCYNNYKEKGMIISKGSNEYYRLFEQELWLVYKF